MVSVGDRLIIRNAKIEKAHGIYGDIMCVAIDRWGLIEKVEGAQSETATDYGLRNMSELYRYRNQRSMYRYRASEADIPAAMYRLAYEAVSQNLSVDISSALHALLCEEFLLDKTQDPASTAELLSMICSVESKRLWQFVIGEIRLREHALEHKTKQPRVEEECEPFDEYHLKVCL